MTPLTVWVLASRPKTLPAAAAPVVIGTAMAAADDGFHLLSALAALVGALLIQIGTNLANDYVDFARGTDTSERLGPVRVTQAGLAEPAAVRRAAILTFALALVVGIYLVYRGGWPIVAIGLLSILFGIAYTAGPAPLAYLGIADLFVLVFFGPVAVGGTYYVQTGAITTPVIIAGIAPGLFSTAILTVNNLRDIESDRSGDKKTLAVRMGPGFARAQFVITVAAACAIPLLLFFAWDGPVASLAALVTAAAAIPTIRTVLRQSGRILNNALAATGRLLLLYSLLFSIGWLL
jgi:1,4-dihydroxy-2-naphthoate octaprenyltransferase